MPNVNPCVCFVPGITDYDTAKYTGKNKGCITIKQKDLGLLYDISEEKMLAFISYADNSNLDQSDYSRNLTKVIKNFLHENIFCGYSSEVPK